MRRGVFGQCSPNFLSENVCVCVGGVHRKKNEKAGFPATLKIIIPCSFPIKQIIYTVASDLARATH